MDTSNGRIDYLENFKPEERENLVVLSKEQDEKLRGMNRQDRRKYYKTHKKEFEGQSWKEING